MNRAIKGAAFALALLVAVNVGAQDEEAVPGAKILERTKADVLLLLPQAGSGGSDKIPLNRDEQKQTEIKIEVEGCEELRGYVSTPIGMDKAKKHAFVFALGGGLYAKEDLERAARLSSGRDPVILAGIQYYKEEKAGENATIITRLAGKDELFAACDWLMKKVLAEYPVDTTRVFVFGERSCNESVAEWAAELWATDADAFPFRACLYDGLFFEFDPDAAPPVAHVFSLMDWEVEDVKGMKGGPIKGSATHANALMARGIPAEYHIFKADWMTSRPDRMIHIHRAAINRLGGPGAEEMPPDESRYLGVKTDADKVPFAESTDPWINELVTLCHAELWKQARERGQGILDDKTIKAKDKKELKEFMTKTFDKYVKAELERLEKSLQTSIKNDFWPNTWHHERMKAMHEAFKEQDWYIKKPYSKTLETIKTYGPATRDAARKVKMFDAVKLELEGKRDEAKKAYQEIAKQKKEDGGVSLWPHAAEYRLSWWE
jgi:hypothetical protein